MNSAKFQGRRSVHKNQFCFYTNNEQSEQGIKKEVSFIISSGRIKCLGEIHLTKVIKGLWVKNYKISLKKIEELNKGKDIPCSWVGRLNIVKMTGLPKVIHRFTTIPIKISRTFFKEMEKSTFKFTRVARGPK